MSVVVCAGCGTANPAGREYCSNCARKLDVETQQAVVARRSEHEATFGTRWTSIFVIAIVAVIIIVMIVLFVTGVI